MQCQGDAMNWITNKEDKHEEKEVGGGEMNEYFSYFLRFFHPYSYDESEKNIRF